MSVIVIPIIALVVVMLVLFFTGHLSIGKRRETVKRWVKEAMKEKEEEDKHK